jgi:hypothetical protein
MTGDFYYCPTCEGVRGEDDAEISTRVSRPSSWGCGNPDCEACFEDRPTPVAFCPVDGVMMTLIPDDEVDPSIFDYLVTS